MKDSSFIKEVVWEDGNLFVRLKSGRFYTYEDVPYEVYEDFVAADSLGKFFGEHIKDQYDFVAYVEPEEKTVKGGKANLPKPWKNHGSDVPGAWPFPVGQSAPTGDYSAPSHWPFPTSKKP